MDAPPKKEKGYQHWCTPPEVVELVHRFYDGPPDLDPWSNVHSLVRANIAYCGPDFGFNQVNNGCVFRQGDGYEPWPREFRKMFGNPNWKQTQRAIQHMRDEWVRLPGREVIGLVPTGPNCSSWPLVIRAPAVCYPKKRLVFWREGEPAPTGGDKDTALPYWGHDQYRFREVFRELGEVVFG